jgi:hypothetical protein
MAKLVAETENFHLALLQPYEKKFVAQADLSENLSPFPDKKFSDNLKLNPSRP